MKKIISLGLLMLLTGCNQYTLVKSEQIDMDGIMLTPTDGWNSVTKGISPKGIKMWTADGMMLNSIMFFSEIADGKPLVKADTEEQYPVYAANMLPNEVMELVESTVAKLYNGTISGTGKLKPIKIGTDPGFQFTIDFIGEDNVPRRLFAAGTTKNEMLYLVTYQATQLYYYDKHLAEVTSMVGNMVIN